MNEYQRKIVGNAHTVTIGDGFIERVSSRAGRLVAAGQSEQWALYHALHAEHECQDWCKEDVPSS